MEKTLYNYYINKLGVCDMPGFLVKYLNCPSLLRLKDIDYFCGMKYASVDIYNFKEDITRFDHSLSTSLLTYYLTKDKRMTIAALFHDISTPCFSHVIDYMNKDYVIQESTEEYIEYILVHDDYFQGCLDLDNIEFEDIIDFKKYSIVDNKRPKMCADRLDGIILNAISWTAEIGCEDIDEIVDNIGICLNEFNEEEISFSNKDVVEKIMKLNENIDMACHSREDMYMMELLADIVRTSVDKGIISYFCLFLLNESQYMKILEDSKDEEILDKLVIFKNAKSSDISFDYHVNVKRRTILPIINEKRII